MSGRHISIDERSGRRTFLKQMAGLFVVPFIAPFFSGCKEGGGYDHITGRIVGANAATGHLLRTGKFPVVTQSWKTDVLIVGGGITGLAAKRWLEQNGISEVAMLEMDNTVGGNSISGKNAASAYPWAAHYLPIPDINNTELLEFLRSIDVIKSIDKNGLPTYNEYHLCHDPEERLYINGFWQEGLIPQFGVSKRDKQQIAKFLTDVEKLRTAKGSDGKYCFTIPLDNSTADETYKHLDKISFDQYLRENGYDSSYLRWYLEYCCKDDYGSNLKQTSAWAGLHYFASRKGAASNASGSAVLTWPEGNAFLMNGLRVQAGDNIRTGTLVHALKTTDEGVEVVYYDVHQKASVSVMAKKVLLATPHYVTKRILTSSGRNLDPSYAPWVVANVTLSKLPHTKGFPLCWDNVIYGQDSVGYVYANHQDLTNRQSGVITYYLPFTADDPVTARQSLHNSSYATLRDRVIKDLSFAHPEIEKFISNVDIWVWGHGMIRPSLGYIWSEERMKAMQPVDDTIFFAHSDLSGISIFEEAFYQGIRAAKQILKAT